MRLIMIGPPGSGKGTQAKLLSERLAWSTSPPGDILRNAVAKETPEGRRAKPFMAAGQLVADEICQRNRQRPLSRKDRPQHFIMDGYPRTLAQAVAFEKVLKEVGDAFDGGGFPQCRG